MTGRERVPDESLATAPVASSRRIHLPALDGIRGIGVMLVLVVHFAGYGPGASTENGRAVPFLNFLAFAFGIPVFFVLSGFLITGILLEAREKAHYFRNFYARRVLRIFPLYYGVLAILFVVHPAWGRVVGGNSSPGWLWAYVSNIELARRNRWSFGYLNHFWSLAVEEQYYFVWPLVVFVCRPKYLLAVCVGLIVFSVVLRVALTAGWSHLVAAYVLTPCWLDPLCTGGALAILVRKWPLRRLQVFARLAVAGSLAAYFLLGWQSEPRASRAQVVGRPLLSCFLFGGAVLLAIGETGFFRRVLGSRPLTFLGRYSYGLYAFHYILVPFLAICFPRKALGRALGSPAAGILSSILLSSAAVLLVSIASYELYEKRFLRLKVRFGR